MAGYNLICCVVNFGDASKVLKSARKYGVNQGYISIGRGTADSRILDFLMINEIRKEIVTMVVDGERTADAIKGISGDMAFAKPHHGIGFSYALSEWIGGGNTGEMTAKTSEVKNSMYKAIYVIVDRGKAEEVVEAANKAGARGGTIVHARGADMQHHKLFSLEIEPEKEKVFIITSAELKDGIVKSIRDQLKIDEPGNGIVTVLDIGEAYGLH